jgi:hypothetical protein
MKVELKAENIRDQKKGDMQPSVTFVCKWVRQLIQSVQFLTGVFIFFAYQKTY